MASKKSYGSVSIKPLTTSQKQAVADKAKRTMSYQSKAKSGQKA